MTCTMNAGQDIHPVGALALGQPNLLGSLSTVITASFALNCGTHRDMTSKHRGVTFNRKCKKWQAVINTAGKHIHLGTFSNEEEAARVFDKAALLVRGPKAKLNFAMSDYMDATGNLLVDQHIHEKLRVAIATPAQKRPRNNFKDPSASEMEDTAPGQGSTGRVNKAESSGTAPDVSPAHGLPPPNSSQAQALARNEHCVMATGRNLEVVERTAPSQPSWANPAIHPCKIPRTEPRTELRTELRTEPSVWQLLDDIRDGLPAGSTVKSLLPPECSSTTARVMGVVYACKGSHGACLYNDGSLVMHKEFISENEARSHCESMLQVAAMMLQTSGSSGKSTTQSAPPEQPHQASAPTPARSESQNEQHGEHDRVSMGTACPHQGQAVSPSPMQQTVALSDTWKLGNAADSYNAALATNSQGQVYLLTSLANDLFGAPRPMQLGHNQSISLQLPIPSLRNSQQEQPLARSNAAGSWQLQGTSSGKAPRLGLITDMPLSRSHAPDRQSAEVLNQLKLVDVRSIREPVAPWDASQPRQVLVLHQSDNYGPASAPQVLTASHTQMLQLGNMANLAASVMERG